MKSKLFDDIANAIEKVLLWYLVLRAALMFFVGFVEIDGISMQPNLKDEQRVAYYHFMYEPKNSDIVLVDSTGLEELIVKRVIATAGQTIDIDFSTGTVSVDGKVLDETYINNATINNEGAFEDSEYPVTVPEGHIFIMGDNRQHSYDSRAPELGFVDKDEVIGKVLLTYKPLNEFRIF